MNKVDMFGVEKALFVDSWDLTSLVAAALLIFLGDLTDRCFPARLAALQRCALMADLLDDRLDALDKRSEKVEKKVYLPSSQSQREKRTP